MNVLGWVILVAVLMILGPVITIWSLNTLFPVLNIPYTMETWAAAGVLFGSAIWKTKD
jgi:hypothetical protein